MISVIVPVYNVEPYLQKCLDSIIKQTIKDLEILVIDDGSTDSSGVICDKYAEKDERIIVFHTENCGLSAARNLGLEKARGEYIGFVDSDDWIETNMYEILLKRAEETEADVVECGVFQDYYDKTVEIKRQSKILSGQEAIEALLRDELYNAVWNKLWRRKCFECIRFPEGRIYEDIATTFQVFYVSRSVTTVSDSKYHYLQRETSLTKVRDMDNLIGYWLSHKERYDFLFNKVNKAGKELLVRYCGEASGRMWSNYYGCPFEQRSENSAIIKSVNVFVKENYCLFGCSEWSIRLRIGVFFPHFLNPISFWMAKTWNHFYLLIRGV